MRFELLRDFQCAQHRCHTAAGRDKCDAIARRQARKHYAASAQQRSFPDSFPDALEIVIALWMAEFAPANRTPILRHSNGLEEFEKPRLVSQRLIRWGPNQGRDIITGRFLFKE